MIHAHSIHKTTIFFSSVVVHFSILYFTAGPAFFFVGVGGGGGRRTSILTYIVSFEALDCLHPGLLNVSLHFLYEDPQSSVDRLQEFVHVREICKARSDTLYHVSLIQYHVLIMEFVHVRKVQFVYKSVYMFKRFVREDIIQCEPDTVMIFSVYSIQFCLFTVPISYFESLHKHVLA